MTLKPGFYLMVGKVRTELHSCINRDDDCTLGKQLAKEDEFWREIAFILVKKILAKFCNRTACFSNQFAGSSEFYCLNIKKITVHIFGRFV